MKLGSLAEKIERVLPLSWAEEWDNTGLAVGDTACDVCRVAVSLDVTERTVAEASGLGCGLLISHHPVIFRPLGSLLFDRPSPAAIRLAVKNDVALYSAHTNWDSSPRGVNVSLAALLGLKNMEPLAAPLSQNGAWGMGAVGDVEESLELGAFMKIVKERWGLSHCEAFGEPRGLVRRAALGGGSCGSMWPAALSHGADVFITADVSYNDRQDALSAGLVIIEADHGEMESASLPFLADLVREETGLEVCVTEGYRAPRIFI